MLKGVKLVMIETRCHELARKAVEDTLKIIDPEEVLIFTDKPAYLAVRGAHYIRVDDWDTKTGWCECYWHKVPEYIKSNEFILLLQWDSWALDPSMWKAEYLNYDYIGAPWPDGVVGNSGFSLRSGHLAHYLSAQKDKFPIIHANEDVLASRIYRGSLEKAGYTWAPVDLALDFSFENVRRSDNSKHFGFHGMFNWSRVLEYDSYKERIEIAKRTPGMQGQFKQLGRIPFTLEQIK